MIFYLLLITTFFPRNRLSPRYINIATDRYNETAGAAAQPNPNEKEKEKKKKLMPTPAD
jgi:hypothetical protein